MRRWTEASFAARSGGQSHGVGPQRCRNTGPLVDPVSNDATAVFPARRWSENTDM